MDVPVSLVGEESACNAGDPSSIPGPGSCPGEAIGYPFQYSWTSLVAQTVKNPCMMQETWVGKIHWRRAWQPTPVFLPGETPWTEEPGGLQSMGSRRVGHNRETKHKALMEVHLLILVFELIFWFFSRVLSSSAWWRGKGPKMENNLTAKMISI